MIISINGAPGSGKSTIAQLLADKLGYDRFYMGGLRREAARKRGMTLAEYNALGETDQATDKEVDDYQAELGRTRDDFVIEGRTSWFLIPHSLKIFLDVEKEEGAKRIFASLKEKNERNEDTGLDSWQAVLESNQKRTASDMKRYKQYYGVSVYDPKDYDLWLDTTNLTREEVFQAVYDFVLGRIDKRIG